MEKITISVDNKNHAKLLVGFLNSIRYIKQVSLGTYKTTATEENKDLPITPAKNGADFMALAGIWKDRDITLEDLRKNAWGGRA